MTRVAPDLAFVAGLPARLLLARHAAAATGDPAAVPTILATLGSIVREGCDSPESLAMRLEARSQVSRVAARRLFDRAVPHLTPVRRLNRSKLRKRGFEMRWSSQCSKTLALFLPNRRRSLSRPLRRLKPRARRFWRRSRGGNPGFSEGAVSGVGVIRVSVAVPWLPVGHPRPSATSVRQVSQRRRNFRGATYPSTHPGCRKMTVGEGVGPARQRRAGLAQRLPPRPTIHPPPQERSAPPH